MELFWLSLLGFLLTGFYVLAGYDYGTQLLLPQAGRDEGGRRRVLAALGPYFFGNEVWLVAVAGVLFGAFPLLEGTLLSGLYPLVVLLLLALVAGKAAVQLRGRSRSATARRVWDVLIVAGGAIPAFLMGTLIGLLLTGVPLRGHHGFVLLPGDVLHPFVLLAGVTGVLLLIGHGGAFLALRATGEVAGRADSAARTALTWAAAAVAGTFAAGLALGVRPPNPLVAAVATMLLVVLPLAGRTALRHGRPGRAFTATAAAVALPVPLAGLSTFPYMLTSSADPQHSLTYTEVAADTATLETLTAFGVVLLPVMLGYQAFSWWAFRDRPEPPGYF
ncbi:cytochrome d ubiquinol oxidase subunit II [Nonomuraea sp. NPDC049480]|uniref:cytochrome d ubiquinol oxidase subunit II n=1 Tax=Nonomuraea sp. NPDC049480 TaxID=3364353 RepID=UPI003787A937